MAHDVKQPRARQARVDELDGMNSAPAFATADDAHAHDLDLF
jgi:hypothetical protein